MDHVGSTRSATRYGVSSTRHAATLPGECPLGAGHRAPTIGRPDPAGHV